MALSKKTRFEIFKRDGLMCRYCGKRPPETILEVDHVVPRCEGGGDEPENLVTSCFDCNRGKGGRPLDAVLPEVDQLAILSAIQETLEQQALMRASVKAAKSKHKTEQQAIDLLRSWWTESIGREDLFEEPSARRFLEALGIEKCRELIYVAQQARCGDYYRWRYFCGCCWKTIKRQEEAV
jgi:hypothetical protein